MEAYIGFLKIVTEANKQCQIIWYQLIIKINRY